MDAAGIEKTGLQRSTGLRSRSVDIQTFETADNVSPAEDDEVGEQRGRDLSSRLFLKDHLDRVLDRPQIAGIAFSGTIGIGLFITSGELIGLSGSLGCVLGFIGAGTIVIAVMRSLAEMVSVRPLFSALMDYPHTFVDPALGFAVGVTYCLAQCLSMATLTSAAARVATNFFPDKGLSHSQTSGIIVGLFFITLLSNICGVRIYGNLERGVKWIKILIILSLCVLMIVVNAGNVGYPTESRGSSQSSQPELPATRAYYEADYTANGLVPFFKPAGFHTTKTPNSTTESDYGIAGGSGKFLAVWTSITLAVFACMGGDIVIVSAGEARRPRRDLPSVTRFMYLFPIGFYILGSFLVGFNVNFSTPDLYRPLAEQDSTKFPSHSPFIIALKHSTLAPHVLPNLYNGLFLFSAYSAGNTGLFAASRTLFALSRQYGNSFLKRTLGRTNAGNTPMAAIFCCSIFGFLAFLGLADDSFNQPILSMSSFFTGAMSCVYGAECVAYLRFKKGLTLLEKDGIFGRDDVLYKRKHYRAHWQPTFAIFGLVGCILIMVFTGWPAIYIIVARNSLIDGDRLKPNHLLAWDLVGAYAGPILFFTLYGAYKVKNRTSLRNPEDAEFRDAYFVPEIENLVDDVPEKTKTGWRYIMSEVWSFIK